MLENLQQPCLLFFCGLFNTNVSSSDYMGLNDGMIREYSTGKDVEGTGHGLIVVLSQHLPGGIEENHETPQSGWLVT
jgi:hypothetical protein